MPLPLAATLTTLLVTQKKLCYFLCHIRFVENQKLFGNQVWSDWFWNIMRINNKGNDNATTKKIYWLKYTYRLSLIFQRKVTISSMVYRNYVLGGATKWLPRNAIVQDFTVKSKLPNLNSFSIWQACNLVLILVKAFCTIPCMSNILGWKQPTNEGYMRMRVLFPCFLSTTKQNLSNATNNMTYWGLIYTFYFQFLVHLHSNLVSSLLALFVTRMATQITTQLVEYTAIPYRASTGQEQGFSCVVFPHREKPVFLSWDPCNENRFFPERKTTQGKPCFHYRDGFAVFSN